MKMVKSLLLGSAAGFMAVAGAQAADMPVKAAPVEYVKICSLYGAGFYYIPGTDICVKIGGWVRFQAFAGNNNNGTAPFFATAAQNQNTLLGQPTQGGNDFSLRARATISMDARSQTEWGTVRTYMNIGWTYNTGAYGVNALQATAESLYVNRGFIQWAGFTFGRAQSFYDFIPQSSFFYFAAASHDTGDPATLLAAYTTQWGNGISTTISVEDARVIGVVNTDTLIPVTNNGAAGLNANLLYTTNYPLGTSISNDSVQQRMPDIVGNFRIDQAWGSFQVMGALHDASAAYFTSSPSTVPTGSLVGQNDCSTPGTTVNATNNTVAVVNLNCGHPGDKFGWAAGVGATFNLPFIAKGDRFSFQVNASEGAVAYVADQPGTRFGPSWYGGASSIGAAWIQDAVLRGTGFAPNSLTGFQTGSLELTKAWGFLAAFEHFWTPALRTSWYGGGYQIDYNSNATTYICDKTALSFTQVGTPTNATGLCNPDSAVWYVGTRTQWNIRPDFYMGVDLMYTKLETAHNGAWAALAATGARPGSPITGGAGVASQTYKFEDQEALSLTFRVQRDIVP